MSRAPTRAKPKEADLLSAIRSRPDIRLYLLYGADESMAEDIARKLAKSVGEGAERIDIDAMTSTLDPAALADEAASLSLFGGKHYIRLRFAADRALAAIDNLLSADHAAHVVIATAGNLTAANKTRKLVEASPRALALACYPADEKAAAAHVATLAREAGLDLSADGARAIALMTSSDRTLAAMEIEKLALYLDAAPDHRKAVPHDLIAELGAETAEENIAALLAVTLSGRLNALGPQLATARHMAVNDIRIVKALQRRVATLSGLTANIRPGDRIEAVVERTPSVFYKERPAVTRELKIWNPPRLARLNQRLLELEARMMHNSGAAPVLLAQELIAIARLAASVAHAG